MRVIDRDNEVLPLLYFFESPRNALQRLNPLSDLGQGNSLRQRDSRGREQVVNIMSPQQRGLNNLGA